MELVINYWAVLIAAIAAIVLGALWYGPLFGKEWMKIVGFEKPEKITKAMQREMTKSYVIMALFTLVMAFVLAHVLGFATAYTEMVGVGAGITAGIWCWLGFIVPVTMNSVIWEGRPWRYWFIISGYYLVSLILMGIILASWQ